MKKYISIIMSAAAAMFISSCSEAEVDNPYARNEGEDVITIDVNSLDFPGRGGSLNFNISTGYDASIATPEWITVTSNAIPGDGRTFVVTATATANSAEGGSDRTGTITITTKGSMEEIKVSQPFYQRPDCPSSISDAAGFKHFIENAAPFYEEGETVDITGDINMDGVELDLTADSFKGVLNGNGFSITNLNMTKPLIDKNNGVISELIIDSSCKISPAVVDADLYFGPFAAKNYGTIKSCENDADIVMTASYNGKNYVGGITGYSYAGSTITYCVNKGEVKFAPASSLANAYIGGMTGYSYGSISYCENYGPLTCDPASHTGAYFMGGITTRHETGDLKYNINHKEATIHTNNVSGSGKSYIGGITGYIEGHPITSANQNYGDLDINLKVESYIGGLLGWQAKVTDADANMFEGSIVNCNIKGYTKGTASNGNNPCKSAGFVVGRFSGQSGYKTLHYGTADQPIKVSGSIYCIATKTSKVASAKDYQALLDGDGSKTSVNNGAIPEADFANILYAVCGDGQTGDPEDLVVRTDMVKLTVPAEGGQVGFMVRGNYDITITPADEWLTSDPQKVAGDGDYHEVTVTAAANTHTYARESSVSVSMPMGTTEIVTISQPANMNVAEWMEVATDPIVLDPTGAAAATLEIAANFDVTATCDAEWITLSPATITGNETAQKLTIKASKNSVGPRTATVTLTMPKGLVKTVSLSQEKSAFEPVYTISTAADFKDFVDYGADESFYPAGKTVTLGADIDLKGIELGAISKFVATLDGAGHSLKNWAAAAALITDNSGVVKNLVIDASCTMAVSANMAYFAATNNGTISGCTNNAKVDCNADPGASARLAGIAAVNKGTISACTNNGAILFTSAADTRAMYLAGIAGSCSTGAVLENCRNNGKIEYTAPAGASKQYKRLAGITAMADVAGIVIKGCVNTKNGSITMNAAGTVSIVDIRNGGIAGELKNAVLVSDCKNFGDLSCNIASAKAYFGGMAGYINSVSAGNTYFAGSVVNCSITGAYAAVTDTSTTNPLEFGGLVFGSGPATATAVHSMGTAEAPMKIAGSVTYGETTVSADASSFKNILNGAKCGNNLTNGFENVAYFASYEAVTKE